MRDVLAIINPKGGVGKTSLVANVAANIAASGRRVLTVDLDARAGLGFDLGYRGDATRDDEGRGLCDALLNKAPLEPAPSGHPNLDVLAGGHHVDFAATVNSRLAADGAHALTRALATVSDDYDLIAIDCPSGGGPMARLALAAAAGAIIPTRIDFASIAAINHIIPQWQDITERYNSDLVLLGVVLTQVPPDGAARAREIRGGLVREGEGHLEVFNTVITAAPEAAYEARTRGLTAAAYADLLRTGDSPERSTASARELAENYLAFTDELLGAIFDKLFNNFLVAEYRERTAPLQGEDLLEVEDLRQVEDLLQGEEP